MLALGEMETARGLGQLVGERSGCNHFLEKGMAKAKRNPRGRIEKNKTCHS